LQNKLSQLGRIEDRLDVKLKVASELPGQLGMALRQQRAADAQLEGLKAEVKVGLCSRCTGSVRKVSNGPTLTIQATYL